MVNRLVFLIFVLFFCGFISFIAVNGTNKIYGKSEVQNISYKLPESWIANISDKQFRPVSYTHLTLPTTCSV